MQELLDGNRALQHKITVLQRELDWLRKTTDARQEYDQSKKWDWVHANVFKVADSKQEGTERAMDRAAAVMKKLKADTGAAGVTKLIVHATNAFDREEKLELCTLLAAGLPPDAALQLRVGLLSTMAADQLRDVSSHRPPPPRDSDCCAASAQHTTAAATRMCAACAALRL